MIALAALGAFIGLFSLWVVLPKVLITKKRIAERSIIYYGEIKPEPSRYESPFDYSGHRIDRVGTISKK
jgi:hypothetical protein